MTNDPDLNHVFDMTKGFCETHGQTEFVCLKCREHDAAMLPRVDLALIKEVQDLRAANETLKTERDGLYNEALELSFHLIDVSNLAFEYLIGVRKDAKFVIQAIQDLADEALNGGAS